jgi:hypothetical protein
MTVRSKYNSLKKRVLKVLADQGSWISVPAIARRVDLPYPERGLYSYFRRLASFGLVMAGRDQSGQLVYRITARGGERYAWLLRTPK